MTSIYKNADKHTILDLLGNEKFYPSGNLVLQKDTFWIYCNARRYWGTYQAALREAGVTIPENFEVTSEYGYQIDWWPYTGTFLRKDWLGLVLNELSKIGGDIRPVALKKTRYFDLCADSYLLFGKYEKAVEYAQISLAEPAKDLDTMEPTVGELLKLYNSSNEEEKPEILKKYKIETMLDNEPGEDNIIQCPVIIDGSNIARNPASNNKPSWRNIRLVDKYLQERGFAKDKIIFIFDANFPYHVDINDFEGQLNRDLRLCLCPSGEQADDHILAKADELQKKNPQCTPYIISNDKFSDKIIKHPELEQLVKTRRRGVTWTFIQKQLEPVINFKFR